MKKCKCRQVTENSRGYFQLILNAFKHPVQQTIERSANKNKKYAKRRSLSRLRDPKPNRIASWDKRISSVGKEMLSS